MYFSVQILGHNYTRKQNEVSEVRALPKNQRDGTIIKPEYMVYCVSNSNIMTNVAIGGMTLWNGQ